MLTCRPTMQRNGLLVTDGGGIRGVLATMALHSGRRDVVKSGCHTLAILSDIQGQGARIAGADGVKVGNHCHAPDRPPLPAFDDLDPSRNDLYGI